jgi:hypothetical protein
MGRRATRSSSRRSAATRALGPRDQLLLLQEFGRNEDEEEEDAFALARGIGADELATSASTGDTRTARRRLDMGTPGAFTLCMNGEETEETGDVEDYEGEGEEDTVRHVPKFTRKSVNWSDPTVLKHRGPTINVEEIADAKTRLCQDTSGWTRGNTSTCKTGACTHVMEWRCSFKNSLSCKAVMREELPGDYEGITELKMAVAHSHVFTDDKSACLPVKVKNLLLQFVLQRSSRCTAMFAALEKGGVDIVDEFPATKQHKSQVRRRRLG